MNWSCATGIGISRAVSAGNAAATTVADYLEHYADDDGHRRSASPTSRASRTAAGFFELDAVGRRARCRWSWSRAAPPPAGARAASSHTGSLATDDRVFDGACRQAGVIRAATIEEAFEAAATFATQPRPTGNRVVVMTTAGGWGVVTADAISRSRLLELAVLPDDLLAEIDTKLPPRWSRNNPVDLAGGETRDTIPEVLEMIAAHDAVDAIVYLGLGIQSNQARMMKDGPVLPRPRARTDRDVPRAAGRPLRRGRGGDLRRHGQADPHRHRAGGRRPVNAGPATVRATGRLCYSSANRAVDGARAPGARRRLPAPLDASAAATSVVASWLCPPVSIPSSWSRSLLVGGSRSPCWGDVVGRRGGRGEGPDRRRAP